MAKSPNAANGASNAPGQNKVRKARPQGPRTLYLILQDGIDPVQFRSQIKQATFNGRVVLRSIEGGAQPSVVKLTVETDKRSEGEGEVAVPGVEMPVAEGALV